MATAHSPILMLEGARPSSVSIWYTDEVDSRDDDTHQGHRLKPYTSRVEALDFSPQGDRFLIADNSGTVRVWKIISDQKLFQEDRKSSLVVQYLFSGLKYVPQETLDFLKTPFKTDSEMIAAARKVSTRLLTHDEEQSSDVGLLGPQNTLTPPVPDPVKYTQLPKNDAADSGDAGTYEPLSGNKALQGLVDDILHKRLNDERICEMYFAAVKADVLLLSGIQNRWAERSLLNSSNRPQAAVILGLSGDLDAVAALKKAKAEANSGLSSKAIDWSLGFLKRQGRDLSLNSVTNVHDLLALKPDDLFAWPLGVGKRLSTNTFDFVSLPTKVKELAQRNHAFIPSRSLSSYAFAIAVVGRSQAYLLSTLAEFFDSQKSFAQARRLAEAARASDPNDPNVENLLGNLASDEGKLEAAISHYRRSLELGRKDGWPEYNMGLVFEKLNDLKAAEASFRAALGRRDSVRRQSELAQFLNQLAWFLIVHCKEDKSKVSEAMKFSEEANVITENKNANYLDTLAVCKFTAGSSQEAIHLEEQAIGLLQSGDARKEEFEERLRNLRAK